MLATLHSEWGKAWSVRAPYLGLPATALLLVAVATSLANDVVHGIATGDLAADARLAPSEVFWPAVLLTSVALAGAVMLPVTSEYSTGSIRSTLLAEPRRGVVMAAKAVVAAVIGLVTGAVSGAVALAGVIAVLGDHGAATAASPIGLVARTAGVLALESVLVTGLAWAVRSAVATLSIAAVLLGGAAVLPDHVNAWTPAGATMRVLSGSADPYHPPMGLLVLAGWAAASCALGAWLLARRDA